MKRICAWCGKGLSGRGRQVSHGICAVCYSALLQCHFEFIEDLPATVIDRAPRSRRSQQHGSVLPDLVQAAFSF